VFAIPAGVSTFVRSVQGAIIIALSAALVGLSLYVWGFNIGPVGFDGLADHLADARAALTHEKDGRRADRATYERAQAEAALKNKAQVQRIQTEQERINEEVSRDLHSRLERLRHELRQKAPAAGGSSQGPGAGADGKAAGGADGAAGLCLAPSELLRAAENEERHDQLIQWIERQLKVER
jgi:hypothetical protein